MPSLDTTFVGPNEEEVGTAGISYLHAGLYVGVLVHDGQNGLHAAVLHQVRLVPHQDQRNPATAAQ